MCKLSFQIALYVIFFRDSYSYPHSAKTTVYETQIYSGQSWWAVISESFLNSEGKEDDILLKRLAWAG